MRLLVGLGNPGAEYARNRHNIGFMALQEIAKRHGIGPWRRRFAGVACEGPIGGERALLLLPGTFMNESGRAVAEAAHFYKLPLTDITVSVSYTHLDVYKRQGELGAQLRERQAGRLCKLGQTDLLDPLLGQKPEEGRDNLVAIAGRRGGASGGLAAGLATGPACGFAGHD